MQAADYLKMKFQSDRQLAIYGQQGVAGTWKALKGIGSDIYSGMERVSWYSSCLSPAITMYVMNFSQKKRGCTSQLCLFTVIAM